MDLGGDAQNTLPPWAVRLLIWICLVLSGTITVSFGWLFRTVFLKVGALEENQKKFATSDQVSEIELRVAPLVSRTEFLAHLQQLRDDQEKRNEQLREDQRRMHKENRDDTAATRSDIRAVHARVDELLSK